MTTRMNELEQEFMLTAFAAQEAAKALGPDTVEEIKRTHLIDYRETGHSLFIFVRQWEAHLGWNPDVCPF